MRVFRKPNVYSVPIKSSREDTQNPIYRNIECISGNKGQLIGAFPQFPTCFTLRELFDHIVDTYYDFPLFGSAFENNEEVEWVTYSQFKELVIVLSKELVSKGISFGASIGVVIENSVWFELAHWCLAYIGAIFVPIDLSIPTNTANQVLGYFKCQHLIFSCKTLSFAKEVLENSKPKYLQSVILACDHEEFDLNLSHINGENSVFNEYRVFSFSEMISHPSAPSDFQFPPILSSSLYSYNVGSGRGGALNGAMLSHSNIIAAAASVTSCGASLAKSVFFSTISNTKPIRRSLELAIMAHGGSIVFSNRPLQDCLNVFSPSIIAMEPLHMKDLYNIVLFRVMESNWMTRAIYDFVFSVVSQSRESNNSIPWVFKTLIVDSFRSLLGSRMKFIISTGYRPDIHVNHFLRTLLQIPIIQVYGTAETCGIIAMTNIREDSLVHVGGPSVSCEIKVKTVGTAMSGNEPFPKEILVKGPNVFMGYYRNSSLTSHRITDEGWFYTGDLGKISTYGTLEITETKADYEDRMKKYISSPK